MNSRCCCYHRPLRLQFVDALMLGAVTFSGDWVSDIRSALWHAEKPSADAED